MSLSHTGVNQIFAEIEQMEATRETIFRGWLAWPLVKATLWHATLGHGSKQPRNCLGDEGLAHDVWRVLRGLLELVINMAFPQKTKIAVLYSSRTILDGAGGHLHPHLGRFLQSHPDALRYVYEWGGGAGDISLRSGKLSYYFCDAAISALARLWRLTPVVQRTANRLADLAVQHNQILPRDLIFTLCRNALAHFVVGRAIFRLIFRRAGVERMLATDSDAKCPEVAAAKSLGISVFEVQHGMFGQGEPDYSWTREYRADRTKMAVPDNVLVFGPLWRDVLVQKGFWGDGEVINVGNAALCSVVDKSPPDKPLGAKLNILFPTQYYVRQASIKFWSQVLERQSQTGESFFRLLIAVHPLEKDMSGVYSELADKYPETCTLMPNSRDGFEAVSEADTVAGYTSFMLLEALGMGIPAISICGGAAPEGMSGTFGLPVLKEAFTHVSGADELIALLRDIQSGPKVAKNPERSQGIFFFPDGSFEEHLAEVIAQHAG